MNKIVKDIKGRTLDDFVNESDALIKKIEAEIVQPIIKKKQEPATTSNPLLVQPPRQVVPPYYADSGRGFFRDTDPLRNIGRGDLDPFGRGGGMIFQPDMPFRPGGLGPLGPFPGPGSLG